MGSADCQPRVKRSAFAANFLSFQLGWFCCVLGAAHGVEWLGPAVVVTWVAVHVAIQQDRRTEILCVIAALPLGFACDSVLVLGDAIEFIGEPGPLEPTRAWMLALWINIAATLRLSLAWVDGRPGVAAVLGAVCGPAAYYAASDLGAILMLRPAGRSLGLIALVWAAALPALFLFSGILRPKTSTSAR